MKCVLILWVAMLLFESAKAQNGDTTKCFGVAVNRTTSVVFPSPIVSIDRGSEGIIVQKSIATILKVKAAAVFQDTTNLTIITAEGKLYSFLVYYCASPDNLTINVAGVLTVTTDTSLLSLTQKVLQYKNNLFGIHTSEGKVQLSLLGLYTTGELVLCKLRLQNNSSLSYAVGRLQVFSKDKQKGKRRSTQERRIDPLVSFNQYAVVREKGLHVLVVILPKPSLNHSRSLRLELSEKDGERNLSLTVSNRFLLNAPIIPSID